jgi:hypothetical protein
MVGSTCALSVKLPRGRLVAFHVMFTGTVCPAPRGVLLVTVPIKILLTLKVTLTEDSGLVPLLRTRAESVTTPLENVPTAFREVIAKSR